MMVKERVTSHMERDVAGSSPVADPTKNMVSVAQR